MFVKASIQEAFDKLKGAFVSLINSGIVSEYGLRPLTCPKIYSSVVLLRTFLWL